MACTLPASSLQHRCEQQQAGGMSSSTMHLNLTFTCTRGSKPNIQSRESAPGDWTWRADTSGSK
jgi:hypothetical protein